MGGKSEDMAGASDRALRTGARASFLAAGCVFLAGEAVAARAWTAPAYDYARDWISDLGAPAAGLFHGRAVNSPLHAVMNAAFVADGLLFLLGAFLLARAAPPIRTRLFLTFAILHSIGMLLIALVPETMPRPVGSLHLLGALLAIGFGNAAILLAGPRRVGLILGLFGLASLAALGFPATVAALGGGVAERMAVYPITAWELIAALWLLTPSAGAAVRRPGPET